MPGLRPNGAPVSRTNHHGQEAIQRGARMLRTALGPAIARLLEDLAVVEVMLNPGGRLWVDRLSEGLSDTGERLSAADGERIVRLVAHHVGAEVHARSPRVSAELPESSERFEGLLPPVVAAPAFAIRKAGSLDPAESALGERIAGLTAIRDQARADAARTEVMWKSAAHHGLTGAAVRELAREARTGLRLEKGGYRRDHVRAFARAMSRSRTMRSTSTATETRC